MAILPTNSAKGPDNGKIVNKLYYILLTTLEFTWLYFFSRKKPDMKFIILVSNLKEISPSVFSRIKEYLKNYHAILLSKYDSLCACANLLAEGKAHGTNKTIDGFYTKTTHKGGFSKLCVKILKMCYTDLLLFQHVYVKSPLTHLIISRLSFRSFPDTDSCYK
jgi:hypothetical protein